MDFEKEKEKMLMKIGARNSSVGCSSRISYYNGSGEGVPFKWETKPGIAKHHHHPPMELQLPPLSPPPALLSLSLPKPSFHHHLHGPRASAPWSTRLRRRLWKRLTRMSGKEGKKLQDRSSRDDGDDVKDLDVFERLLECNSDFESLAPPRDSSFSSPSSSSSSSSSSSLCRLSMQSIRSDSPFREIYRRPLGCIHMYFTRNLISIVKRD